MTDARRPNSISSWMNVLTLGQKLAALAGVVLFFVGLIAGPLFLKIVLFIAASCAIAYVVVTYRGKGFDSDLKEEEEEDLQSPAQNSGGENGDAGEEYDAEPAALTEPSPEVDAPEPQTLVAPRAEYQEHKYEFQLSDFFDLNEDVGAQESGPKSEFTLLMKKVLSMVQNMYFAHTAALFWINRDKKQLVLESYVTNSTKFTCHRRRELGLDLISQIANSGKPQLVTEINELSQPEMLGYYEEVEPVKAFVGVPIFYAQLAIEPQHPVAVLAMDCLEQDAYGTETLASLGNVTKLISGLIRSYTDKYDLLLDSELLRSITRMRDQLKLDFTVHTAARSLIEETSRLIAWDYLTVVLFDDSRKAWVVQMVMNRMNDPYVSVTNIVDHQRSLVGDVIQSATHKIVDHVTESNLPRFFRTERCESKGSVMILPLNSLSRCYGALVVESKDAGSYSESDVRLVQKVVDSSSWALEILGLTEVTNAYVTLDETTGVANHKYFMGRVQEEVQRANDFNTDISIVMISIDSITEHMNRIGKEGCDFILQNVGRMIRSSIRPYDLVGRFDFNRFAVLLVNTTPNEASLWAEKLRKNVASNIINVENRSFSVTISIGISGAVNESSDMELLEKADRVLKRAVEAGGNIVRVY
ncbi:MAG TPA: sensor domain-containing diguanylate cyclase [Bacteroidota bacterium]|nr:sensor domain-containing diguanylate cyclase [Bacteroidota bacterium]